MLECKLLIVDDERANLVLMESVLAQAGFTNVTSIADSSQVLTRCRQDPPDLIVLDLHMPVVDGNIILAALAELFGPDDFFPIVVLTADTTTRARDEALRLGATDFITKPFDITDVVLRIRNLLRTRVANNRLRMAELLLRDQVSALLEVDEQRYRRRQAITERVIAAAHNERMLMVYQPIVDLVSGKIVGAEAFARFPMLPLQPPPVWFAEAAEVGLGLQLELAAIRAALAAADSLPVDTFLSLNASPETLCSERLGTALDRSPDRLVMLELTEQRSAGDEERLAASVDRLRQGRTVGLAIDNTGAGQSSLSRILRLRPQLIKLDRFLIEGIDRDPVRRAMTAGLVRVARELGAGVVAGCIETGGELTALRDLGVGFGQGHLFQHPRSLPFEADHIRVDQL